MYGVIRFLDTDFLPASSPEDYPKIIKSGIDEEGQHHKSPKITGGSGIATLLHRIGRQELLERLFDTTGTEEFHLRVLTGYKHLKDLYVTREGANVEIGLINSDGDWAQHGVRYRIEPEPAGSPYQVGKWIPVSTSDLDSPWGGPDVWVRAQGADIAKAIWFHGFFDFEIEVSWSGMTEAEKEELAKALDERAKQLAERRRIGSQEYEERKAKYGERHYLIEERMGMEAHYRTRLACRADCGEQDPKLYCSKCKIARYCNVACQSEDWKSITKLTVEQKSPFPKRTENLVKMYSCKEKSTAFLRRALACSSSPSAIQELVRLRGEPGEVQAFTHQDRTTVSRSAGEVTTCVQSSKWIGEIFEEYEEAYTKLTVAAGAWI